ncbi:hypothetical protein DFH11DRAFT_1504506 [Phellopilus nigrolimitatus]|nr:hypothetical protein DFH11DRAFT_1504506 [Phellopilus nigrolimitatus]
MPAARHAKRPIPSCTPRSTINISSSSLPAKIDSALKQLRAVTRQLSPLEACLADELRLLERLYYKGVNQHRSALFWRRVEETRRLGKRVHEMQMQGLTDDLRYLFYCARGGRREEVHLKSAWAQVPDARFVHFTHERTRGSLELIARARERFSGAFHSFSLMMQTGAFLQLILTLTAIVSRMDALVAEMSTVLETLSATLSLLLEALGEKKAKIKSKNDAKRPIKSDPRSGSDVKVDFVVDEIMDEDLGSAVIRRNVEVPSSNSNPDHDFSADSFLLEAEPVPSLIVSTTVEHASSTVASSTAGRTPKDRTGETKKTKKKKKRDEIDDIFGTL